MGENKRADNEREKRVKYLQTKSSGAILFYILHGSIDIIELPRARTTASGATIKECTGEYQLTEWAMRAAPSGAAGTREQDNDSERGFQCWKMLLCASNRASCGVPIRSLTRSAIMPSKSWRKMRECAPNESLANLKHSLLMSFLSLTNKISALPSIIRTPMSKFASEQYNLNNEDQHITYIIPHSLKHATAVPPARLFKFK